MKKIIIIITFFVLFLNNTFAFDYGNGKYIDNIIKQKVDTLIEKLSDSKKATIQDKVQVLLKRNFSKKSRELLEYIDYAISLKEITTITQTKNIKTNILYNIQTSQGTGSFDYKKIKDINELFTKVKDKPAGCIDNKDILEIDDVITGSQIKYILPENSFIEINSDSDYNINWDGLNIPIDLTNNLITRTCKFSEETKSYKFMLSTKGYSKIETPIVTISKACKIIGDSEYENAMDEYLKTKNFVNDIHANNGGRNCMDILNSDIIEVFGKDFYDSVKGNTYTMGTLSYLIVFNGVDASKQFVSTVPKNKDWLYYRQFWDAHRKIDQGKLDTAKDLQRLVDGLIVGMNDSDKKIETIFNWIINNIKYDDYTNNLYAKYKTEEGFWDDYQNNPKVNEVALGISTYKNKTGICSGYAQLFSTMLSMAGIDDQEIKTGLIGNDDIFSNYHAWNRVGSYYYDPTWGKNWYKLKKDLMYQNRKDSEVKCRK